MIILGINKTGKWKNNIALGMALANVIIVFILFIINRYFIFVPVNVKFLFRFLVIWGIINGAVLIGYSIYKHKRKLRIIVIVTLLTIILASIISTNKIFNHKRYRNLAGEIKTYEFSKDIEAVDLTKLPINNSVLAKNLADKKLGEIPSLGSQVDIGEFTIQKVKGELYYVAPLEHEGFFKWYSNKKGTPGYVMVSATKQNDIKLVTELNGKPINLKYLNSSYFMSNLKRHAFLKKSTKGLTDYSFELDDEGNPYWAISMYDLSVGLSGEKIEGTLLIDAQTGEAKTYSIEETPSWVDRIQPKDIVQKNLSNWGELVHGVFNFSNKDELTLTEGIKVTYNGGDCYYYTGVTSVGADESLVGFFLTNSRTGVTSLYRVSGAIETAAVKSAEGKVQQYGYTGTFPILTNIQSQPTYFTTLLDNKGLIKNYAFVNVQNYNIVGVGETLNEAYNDYIKDLSNDTSIKLQDTGDVKNIEGIVDRIGEVLNSDKQYYMLTLKDNKNIFIIPTSVSDLTSITKEKDKVKIKYTENKDKIVIVKEFENITLKGE